MPVVGEVNRVLREQDKEHRNIRLPGNTEIRQLTDPTFNQHLQTKDELFRPNQNILYIQAGHRSHVQPTSSDKR